MAKDFHNRTSDHQTLTNVNFHGGWSHRFSREGVVLPILGTEGPQKRVPRAKGQKKFWEFFEIKYI